MTTLLRHMYRWAMAAVAAFGLSVSCQKAGDAPSPEPTSYDVRVEDFSTTRETLHIGGKLYLPEGRKGQAPAAILCHGIFGSYESLEAYALSTARMGMIAVTFDFCGGPSGESLSDGTHADNSVLSEVEDLTAVYRAMVTRADVDPSKVIIMGASQGGLVSSLFAAQYPSEVKALVLFYPAFNLPDMVRTALDVLYDGDIDKMPESLGMGDYSFSKKYVRDVLDMDPYEMIRKYKGPVKIFHGDIDPFVPLEVSQKAITVYPNANLIVLKDQGHVFNPIGRKEAAEHLETWLRDLL